MNGVGPAGAGARELAERAIALAGGAGLRIAVAESLTGGLLAAALVDVPGASHAFSGGVVAYDTALKASLLGVDPGLLAERGPVDAEVARQMARGVRRACAAPAGSPAHVGVATTGVAGPDPDPLSGQPAGTVWIGVSSSRGERAARLRLSGDRGRIRSDTAAAALAILVDELGLVLAAPESRET